MGRRAAATNPFLFSVRFRLPSAGQLGGHGFIAHAELIIDQIIAMPGVDDEAKMTAWLQKGLLHLGGQHWSAEWAEMEDPHWAVIVDNVAFILAINQAIPHLEKLVKAAAGRLPPIGQIIHDAQKRSIAIQTSGVDLD